MSEKKTTLESELWHLVGQQRGHAPGLVAALKAHYESFTDPFATLQKDRQRAIDNKETLLAFWQRFVVFEYRRTDQKTYYRLLSDFQDREDLYNFRLELQDRR